MSRGPVVLMLMLQVSVLSLRWWSRARASKLYEPSFSPWVLGGRALPGSAACAPTAVHVRARGVGVLRCGGYRALVNGAFDAELAIPSDASGLYLELWTMRGVQRVSMAVPATEQLAASGPLSLPATASADIPLADAGFTLADRALLAQRVGEAQREMPALGLLGAQLTHELVGRALSGLPKPAVGPHIDWEELYTLPSDLGADRRPRS